MYELFIITYALLGCWLGLKYWWNDPEFMASYNELKKSKNPEYREHFSILDGYANEIAKAIKAVIKSNRANPLRLKAKLQEKLKSKVYIKPSLRLRNAFLIFQNIAYLAGMGENLMNYCYVPEFSEGKKVTAENGFKILWSIYPVCYVVKHFRKAQRVSSDKSYPVCMFKRIDPGEVAQPLINNERGADIYQVLESLAYHLHAGHFYKYYYKKTSVNSVPEYTLESFANEYNALLP